jgi:crotonobetainyl-CoA:carnitine CoA-transferase CaiB-like acyl-CoA transferase
MTTPLAKLRMLDLSRQLPGPFCSTILGDLGMDVLVIGARPIRSDSAFRSSPATSAA